MAYIAWGLLLLCLGLIFVVIAFTEPTCTLPARIFAICCGLIFLALPVIGLYSMITEKIRSKRGGASPAPPQPCPSSVAAAEICF